jgi:hypothetical protein
MSWVCAYPFVMDLAYGDRVDASQANTLSLELGVELGMRASGLR